jgi:hypothetical protein
MRFRSFFSEKFASRAKKFTNARPERKNSSGMHATFFSRSKKFFYKSVAFFFERSLELAHQALKSGFGNGTGVTAAT